MKGKVQYPGKHRGNVGSNDFNGLRGKPSKPKTLMMVKALQGMSDFQFSNERVGHGNVCVCVV